MMNFTDHSTNNGRILLFHRMVHLLQPKCIKSSLLIDRSSDSTLCLSNLYSCHNLTSEYFFH